jgi:hypothetical protein
MVGQEVPCSTKPSVYGNNVPHKTPRGGIWREISEQDAFEDFVEYLVLGSVALLSSLSAI